MITRFVLRWIFNAVAVYVTTLIVTGLQIPEPVLTNTVIIALVLGVVNAFIRPVVLLLTLPVNILTLGLFTLIVNTLMLYLVAAVTPLTITGFGAAFIGALLIAIISTVLSHVLRS
jgi:putative membrane protein